MIRTHRTRLVGALACLGLLAAACGSDDTPSTVDDPSTVAGDASDEAGAGDGASTTDTDDAGADGAVATMPSACPTSVPFDMELRSDGDGAREVFTVVDAVALRRAGGVAITVYLADFDMPDDTSWEFAVPEVPAGGTLVSTGLDVFNADPATLPVLEAGDSGGLFSDVGDGETATFLSIVTDDAGSTSSNQSGTSELVFIDDDQVCLTVAITGESGFELLGNYSAPIVADI